MKKGKTLHMRSYSETISLFPLQLKLLVCGSPSLWGPTGLKFINEMERKIKEKTGNKNATSHIIQAISMTVQSGNAAGIMGTLGPQRKLEDFFDVISPREEKSEIYFITLNHNFL